tara:strand:- start:1443 stop:1751 length:309 start_codon:yes stop_codon:yes gene_type:complete
MNIIKILIILFFLTSCQSTKDALTLKKKDSADEFLIEKKNPLVLPPEYGKLPTPNKVKKDPVKPNDDVINILANNSEKNTSIESKTNSTPTSIEESVLKKIK